MRKPVPRPDPGPWFEDVGRMSTFEDQTHDGDGRWEVIIDAPGVSTELEQRFDTEGQAVDAGKKWAADRGLFVTWQSAILRRKLR
jgi:hypothetical protein